MGALCSCGRPALSESDTDSNWDDHFPPMTRSALRRKREIFWATRTGGRREIWMGLRTAAELHRDGDFESSKAIIEAMGCTVLKMSKKRRGKFCYDDRGNKYKMPMYLFQEPRNLVENKSVNSKNLLNENSSDMHIMIDSESNEEVSFKVRLNVGKDIDVIMREQDSIKALKEIISSKINNLDPTKIRIISKGKMYHDSYRICDPFPIKNGDIVHASCPSSLYKELNTPTNAMNVDVVD